MNKTFLKYKIILLLTICFFIPNIYAISFPNQTATFSIAENSPIGTVVGRVFVTGDSENIRYRISQGFDSHPDDNYFSIVQQDINRGQIKVAIPPDFEYKNSLKIQVGAGPKGSGKVEARITITINITDVDESDNNAPIFSEGNSTKRYLDATKESTQSLGSITATGSGNIEYFITKDPFGFFDIDKDTGILSSTVTGSASYNTISERTYNITVGARDTHKTWNYIDVSVILDKPPIFTEPKPIIRTIEAGTETLRRVNSPIIAEDPDGDNVKFNIKKHVPYFVFNRRVGYFANAYALRAGTTLKGIVTATSVVNGDNGLSTDAEVHIIVIPKPGTKPKTKTPTINNAPIFSEGTSTERSVSENTTPNNNIGNPISATDTDGDILTYTLDGTDASSFDIDTNNGQLKTKSALDYETKSSYQVTVHVTDNKNGSDSINVAINITDLNEKVIETETPKQPDPTPPEPEVPKPEVPKPETPEPEVPKPEVPKPETPEPEVPKPEVPKPETPEPEVPEPNYTIKPFDYKHKNVGNIIFSEIMLSRYNERSGKDDLPQWIELYNTTDDVIDLKDWKIVLPPEIRATL